MLPGAWDGGGGGAWDGGGGGAWDGGGGAACSATAQHRSRQAISRLTERVLYREGG